ncbi:MAG: sensor histidine kinase [Deltaproteobacteria bacterium]|nr:sensor histidine kinase [Deltaproteobacteria bacterium]
MLDPTDQHQLFQPRTRLAISLSQTVFWTLVGMTIFEVVKDVLFPDTTLWESHIMTIVFSGAVSAIVALVVYRKQERLHQRLQAELEKRVEERTAAFNSVSAELQLAEQRQQTAILAERNRLAREIHDTLSQGFTGIVIQLETAEDVLEHNPEDLDSVLAHLSLARTLARASLAEARRSVWELRPHALAHQPLTEAITTEVTRITDGTTLTAMVVLSGAPRPVPADIEDHLLRISQEAITNVLQHARARTVRVTLSFTPASVCLRIEDDGRGATGNGIERKGFGLISMRERAERIRGHLTISKSPGHGTCVLVEVPLAATSSGNDNHEQPDLHPSDSHPDRG